MAKGGWKYGTYKILPHANTEALWFADAEGISDAIVGLGEGWSKELGPTAYATFVTGWGILIQWLHSSGARLVFIMSPGTSVGSINFLLGANNQHNQNVSGSLGRNQCAFAYLPPGNSGFGAADPYTAGYIPLDGFKFARSSYSATTGDPVRFFEIFSSVHRSLTFHFVGKGDDIFAMLELGSHSSRSINYFWAMGTLLDPTALAHLSAETDADLRCECFIGALDDITSLWSNTSPCSFFRTPSIDGSPRDVHARVRGDGATVGFLMPWGITALANTFNYEVLGKVPTFGPYLYISRVGDGATESVVPGNGMKGLIDHEKLVIVPNNAGMVQRQTLDGGNYIYVGGGIAIGWDPSNGTML